MPDCEVARRRAPRVLAPLAAVLALALAAGCTMLRVGYGQLDSYALWRADQYFDLTPPQRDQFRARFERLHAWHRAEQLPDYARFLASVSERIRNGPTSDDGRWIARGLEARYRALVARGAEDAAAMLMTVAPQQLDALKARWRESNERYARRYRLDGSRGQEEAARLAREIERIEQWTGDLNPAQEKAVALMLREVPPGPRLWHEERLRRQRAFLELMAQRGDPREFSARVRHFLVNWEDGRAPARQRAFDEWREKKTGFYVQVVHQLNSEQRATLLRRLGRYTEDFRYLAQRRGGAAAAN